MMTMIPCSSTVDDLVQETFLTVHQKADSFSAGTNFRAWVFTIARYKVLSASRRPELREKCFEPETIERLMDEVPQFEVDSPHLRALSRCIGKLAPKARRALELRYLSHHKPQAIAVKMNWTVGAINVALSRARVVLRKCIESQVSKDSMPQHSSS
jgi:RNA polymerase sigma-70 factor (ECF subfamily)